MVKNNGIVEWWKDRSKDSLDYFYTLTPIRAKLHGLEVSIPEGAKLVSLSGDWVEFGVFVGTSARKILEVMPSNIKLYLFDSFEGLPEEWEWGDKFQRLKGHFALKKNQIPEFDDERVIFKIGLFKDTISVFVEEHPEPLPLIHIDCDIYSSAICVLDGLNDLIVPGTIIIFDELYNYPRYLEHEYRALQEFRYKHNRQFEYCGRSDKWAAWIKMIK